MVSSRIGFINRHSFDAKARVLGRIGNLETRLARSTTEVRKAQEIRYQVFYEELGATANRRTKLIKRDKDRFDKYCDHLLVIEHSNGTENIIGTYRLLPDRQARLCGGFYTQSEFNISPLLQNNNEHRFLELGRSCVLKEHRSKRVMELMWQGLWSYVLDNKIDILFGCASFQGTDLAQHSASLGWLVNRAKLNPDEDCIAQSKYGIDLGRIPFKAQGDVRRVVAGLPPLLKGYLRVGAKIGTHAVVDHQFKTIDVLVALKVADIAPRYLSHYGKDASRFAA
jgi:putative hemolysin